MKTPSKQFFWIIIGMLTCGSISSASIWGDTFAETVPTDADIARSGTLQQPVVPIGRPTTAMDNILLTEVMPLFAEARDQDDQSAILGFLSRFPDSPWRASVLNTLGLRYRQTGWFVNALKVWEEAWQLTKNDQTLGGKALADCVIGELATLNAGLGRKDEVAKILKEVDKRPLIGPAAEQITIARESLWLMQHEPENAFKCGVFSVARLAATNNPSASRHPKIVSAHSSSRGMSLAQVWRLSREIGMQYQIAQRKPGADVITPCIVNWKTNHFATIVREDQGKFVVHDPSTYDPLLVSKAALDAEASGYFLVPSGPLPRGWSRVSERDASSVRGAGGTRFHDKDGTKPWDDKAKKCPPRTPMASYNFHTQLVSLNIVDTPVGYTPPRGPDMHFTITYNQREKTEATSNLFSQFGTTPGSGQLWVGNCIAWVQRVPVQGWPAYVHLPGGGVETYFAPTPPSPDCLPDRQSGAILTLHQQNGLEWYSRTMPDGSKQLFEKYRTGAQTDNRFFMTKWIDPLGNTVLFNWDQNFRLTSITDALNQVTTIRHLSDNPQVLPQYYIIHEVEDPFGRSAIFDYDQVWHLWRIQDAGGIVSTFHYEPGTDFIDIMTTPYKTTHFSHPPSQIEDETADNHRIIHAVDEGTNATERVEFAHRAPGVSPSATPLPNVPGIEINNELYHNRNSFYWDKKASEGGGFNDYTKAKLIQWLHYDLEIVSSVKEREKMPLEDPVYYFYPGQGTTGTGTTFLGNSAFPSIVARVLDDGATQLSENEYDNRYHKLTKSTDAKGRVTTYQYAENGIDLIAVFQKTANGELADQLFGCTYYDFGNGADSHLPEYVTDTAGQTTHLTYTPSKQLETVTNPRGEVTVYEYGDGSTLDKPRDYLIGISRLQAVGPPQVTEFRYDIAHRVRTIKSIPDGYLIIKDYDNLDRVTQITYQDGTTEVFSYEDPARGTTLDLTATKDRLNRWTKMHYDADRNLDSVTEAEDTEDERTTQYGWCNCGALESILDPEQNLTTFVRDLQNRVIYKVFATGNPAYTSAIHYTYENRTNRLSTITDALGQTTNYVYEVDDNLDQIRYLNTLNATPAVNYDYDDYYNRISSVTASGVGPSITTSFTYHPAGRLGGGQVETIGGVFTGDTITYGYDQLGRQQSRSIGGVAEVNVYDSLGRLGTTDNDVLGHFDREYDGATPRLERLIYPNGQTTQYTYSLANEEDRRLKTIENLVGTANLSKFDYTYDSNGRIMSWTKLLGATQSGLWFGYDHVDQLRSARNAESIGNATRKFEYVYDSAGNRTYDRDYNPNGPVSTGIANSYGINVLNQVETRIPSGSVAGTETQTFVYDAAGNLSNDGAGKSFEWDAANRLIAINYVESGTRTEFGYDGLGRRVRINEYGPPAITADIEPPDTNYTSFTSGKFTLAAGDWTLTLQGLNPSGGDNTMLVDSVTLDAVPILNGSFETPTVHDFWVAPTGAGWSFSGTAGISGDSIYTNGNPPPPEGNQVAFVRNYGSISQTLSVPGGTYKVRLQAAQRHNGNEATQRLRVSLWSAAELTSSKTLIWCGNQICEERDGSGTQVKKRFFDQGEQKFFGGSGVAIYYYTRDHLSSIREVTDNGAVLIARYDYDPYGNRVVVNGQMDLDFGYTGHYYHAPSGLNLTLYRAYDPKLGRWITRDPIGEVGGINLYGYVGNDPVHLTDSLGLLSLDEASNFVAGWGDTLSTIPFTDLSITRGIRNSLPGYYGENGGVDRCSSAYKSGGWAGIANSLFIGGKGAANFFSRFGKLSTRAKLYEIGQTTLTSGVYSRYSGISNPVRRGIAMVRDGTARPFSITGLLTQSWKTIPTGLTPEAAASLRDAGAAIGGGLVGATGILNKLSEPCDCP